MPDGKLEDGLGALAIEAKRVREFGFSASELDRAKQWMAAFYERAYNERDKTESGSFAQEYLSYFLERRAEPGHRLRVPARQAAAARRSRVADVIDAGASALLGDDSRVILAIVAAEGRRQDADRSRAAGGAARRPTGARSRRGPTRRRRAR